jgi:hypothetical protein
MRRDDFTIEGDVVDESGSPLNDVNVVVSTSRQKFGGDSDSESDVLTFRGSHFRVDRRGYSSVYLVFTRTGHKHQTLGFDRGGEYRNLRVVLIKETPPTSATTAPSRAASRPNSPR